MASELGRLGKPLTSSRIEIPHALTIRRLRFTPPTGTERERLRAKYGFDAGTCGIVCVRRLVYRTGIDLLVDAMTELASRDPENGEHSCNLLIAGRGAEEAALREAVKRSPAANRIEFLRYVPDEELPDLYRAADLTVMHTRALEGFGLATLESLACGTPVVATPVGGSVEIIGLLDPRLLTDGVNPIGIASTIEEFLNAPAELAELRERSLEHAGTFEWSGIARCIAGDERSTPRADSKRLAAEPVASS